MMSAVDGNELLEYEHSFLCLSRGFDSTDELKSYFEDVNGLDTPEFLGNRMVDVDLDSPRDSELMYSDVDLEEYEGPLTDTNYILMNVTDFGDDGDKFHVHYSISDDELLDEFSTYLNKIISAIDYLELSSHGSTFASDLPFGEYDLPIDQEHEFDVFGVRISSGDYRYTFQDDSEMEETETTTFQAVTNREFVIDDSNSDQFLADELRNAVEFLTELEL